MSFQHFLLVEVVSVALGYECSPEVILETTNKRVRCAMSGRKQGRSREGSKAIDIKSNPTFAKLKTKEQCWLVGQVLVFERGLL